MVKIKGAFSKDIEVSIFQQGPAVGVHAGCGPVGWDVAKLAQGSDGKLYIELCGGIPGDSFIKLTPPVGVLSGLGKVPSLIMKINQIYIGHSRLW